MLLSDSCVTELVPTYRSVTVHYRPEIIGYARLYEKLNNIVNGLKEAEIPPAGEIRVPVLYGGEHGPDLENVAKLHNMTPEEVIRLHTAPTYLNYMLGFLPGFLGDIPFLRIGLPAILSIYFDVFSGIMQAFIFAMLTMLNVAGAVPWDDWNKKRERRGKQALSPN